MFRKSIALLAIALFCFIYCPAFAASSTDEAVLGADRFSVTSSGNLVTNSNGGVFIGSSENVTTSAANPGVGVASLSKLVTNVTTDATGASADVISLADGTTGQVKIITLKVDAETTGLKVTPASLAAGSDILLEDVGDSVTLVFNGTAWVVTSTNGGTIE